MKECAGAVGTLADKRSEVPRMDEILNCVGFAAQDAAAKQERRYGPIRYWRIFRYSAQSANTPA